MATENMPPQAGEAKPMPAWPKPDEFGYAFDELSAKDAALRFQRARADAAVARLRVAVEALQRLSLGAERWEADEAIDVIGEIPE